MIVWLKKTDGTCVRLSDDWRPRIHVGGDIDNLEEIAWKLPAYLWRFVERFEKAGHQSKSMVLEIEVENDGEALSVARRIQRYGDYSKFRLYDVDIPSAQMYLYEKDLFPLASVEAEEIGDRIEWSLRDSRESLNYALPPLRNIKLQVNTKSDGRIHKFEDKLDSIIIHDGNETIALESDGETENLRRLAELFREIDPDIVLTEGGDSFIFPYLARRAELHGIHDEMILGREDSPLRISEYQGHSYFSYGKILFRQTAARLLGRLHIDKWNSFFVEDCGLEGLFEVARTCIIPVQRCSRTTIGTSMTSLQLYEAIKRNVLIPWNKNEPEDFKNGNELVVADRGGFIFEPQIGIHDDVGEFDFSSLYPTIMLKHNLSGETVKCKCCPNSANRVPELGYNICEKRIGIVPRSLQILLRKRATYKKYREEAADSSTRLRYDQRQAALKWILVCSFGYLGFKNARFGKIDAHIATCAFSRNILKKAVAIAESHGFKLIHGIVDSMWLKKPSTTDDEYKLVCAQIEKQLDLPISFEGRYKWIVFLNSRINPRVPVLNRYYGVLENGTLKVRGIDLRKHDTPEIVRKCQTDMLNVLSKARNSSEFMTLIPEVLGVMKSYVTMLRTGKVPGEELVIEKRLSKMPDEYTSLVPQAIAARHLVREGINVNSGQNINFLLTHGKSGISQNRALPFELAQRNMQYDSESYVQLLLSSTLNLILPFGYNLKTLLNNLTVA